MYAAPTANIVAAGHISKSVKLYKGTRQGCPLSPLLFNLALEPLSRYLFSHPSLHSVQIGQQELRLALFTDDILIFSSNPTFDMLLIQDVFTQFRGLSGLNINFAKSEILPLFHCRIPSWAKITLLI